MASPSVTHFSYHAILFLSISTTFLLTIANAHEFTVGGSKGWTIPPASDDHFYSRWAFSNDFQIGDILNFLNEDDSVLVVRGIIQYIQCNTTNPVQEIPPGKGVFQFMRYGFYFFTSEQVDSCLAGQRMIAHVMDPNPKPGPINPSVEDPPAMAHPITYISRPILTRQIFNNSTEMMSPRYQYFFSMYGALLLDAVL